MTTAIEKTEFEAMDALDEQQIVEELKGNVIAQYFYEFSQAGKQVVGISWAGIKWISQKMAAQNNAISIEDLQTAETNESFKVLAMAMNLNTKEKRYGAAQCAKTMKLKDNTERENPFAWQIALSKAQRNAIRNFIPEIAIQEGYKEWKNPPQKSIDQVFGDRIQGDKK